MTNQKIENIKKSILLLIKADATYLTERIKNHKREYINEFSLKRTRTHFPAIFFSRYRGLSLSELKVLGPELIVTMEEFYYKVSEMEWYLNHTQDMINTVEDKVDSFIRAIKAEFAPLLLLINSELEDLENEENSESDKNHDSEEFIEMSDGPPPLNFDLEE